MITRGERERMPVKRRCTRIKFRIGKYESEAMGCYLEVGCYPDGRVGEVFINLGKPGSPISAMFGVWAITLSKALQYGGNLHELLTSYHHEDTRGVPLGKLWCDALPDLHKKKYKNPWACIAAILLAITSSDGRLIE